MSRRSLASIALLTVMACASEGDGDSPAVAEPARIVIAPGTVLLTTEGESRHLAATVTGDAGTVLDVPVTWRSLDDAVVSISAEGLVTARTGLGSAQVVAELGALRSAPVVVLIATPAAETRLVADEDVIEGPSAVDPDAVFEPGFRVRAVLRGTPPPLGSLLLGTGDQPIAGRVAEVSAAGGNTEVVLEIVPLGTLFADLEIDQSVALTDASISISEEVLEAYDVVKDAEGAYVVTPRAEAGLRTRQGQPMGTRALGPFGCTVSGQLQVALAAGTLPSLRLTPALTYAVRWSSARGGLQRLRLSGSIEKSLEVKPRVTGAFEGKLECKVELFFIRLPLGGPVGLFIGGQVPLGAGFEVSGKATLASFGVDLASRVTASAELGFDCSAGTCQPISEASIVPETSLTWTLPDPQADFRFEPAVVGNLFFDLELGNPFLRALTFNAVQAQAGVKLSGNLGPLAAQALDAAYASGYGLAGYFEIKAGTSIQALAGLLQISFANPLNYTLELPIAQSPGGTFTLAPRQAGVGASVEATVALDPERLSFLGAENVASVEIYRLIDQDLELETTLTAMPGQTEFSWSWVPEEADRGPQTFVAFVRDGFLGLTALEVTADSRQVVTVGEGSPCNMPPTRIMSTEELERFRGETTIAEAIELSTQGTVDSLDALNSAEIFACDFWIYSPALSSIASLTNLREVAGELRIAGPSITSLEGLGSLRRVGGVLRIEGSIDSLQGLESLESTGPLQIAAPVTSLQPLAALTSIGGLQLEATLVRNLSGLENVRAGTPTISISISSNVALENLVALSGLSAAVSGLSIQNNPALATLNGLSGLTAISGSMTLGSNRVLTSLAGLSNLRGSLGHLTIESNGALTSLDGLEGLSGSNNLTLSENARLSSIAGLSGMQGSTSIRFTDNPVLSSLAGLEGITEGYIVRIEDAPLLTDVSGLSGLETVISELSFRAIGATSFSALSGLRTIGAAGAGVLSIRFNPNLADLGMPSLTLIDGGLTIEGNPMLPIEDAQEFAGRVQITGPVTIR